MDPEGPMGPGGLGPTTLRHNSVDQQQPSSGRGQPATSSHFTSTPSTSRGGYDYSENMSVDDALVQLLAPLRLDHDRNHIPTEEDDEQLRSIHERISSIIERERDEIRRRRLRRACPCANAIREQILYLRRLRCESGQQKPPYPSASYFPRLTQAFDTVVKDSFDEEYRKVAIVLGVVEAVAEILVLEVEVFGVGGTNQTHANEHRTLRKLVANALTNLTYGHVGSKRALCSHQGFIGCLVAILLHAPNLVQVYAGLLRNLSWMADAEMGRVLGPACPALATAFLAAFQRARSTTSASGSRDAACVSATLSALWNLASHSVENKRAICETPYCVNALAALLTPDSKMTVVVESASGVLKYASQYLASSPAFADTRGWVLTSLLHVLHSSSFTVVANSVSAIESLVARDRILQNVLRGNRAAYMQLNVLRNSAREDIRAIVKRILNHLNDPMMCASSQYTNEMSASLGSDLLGPPGASRLLNRRSPRASPGAFLLNAASNMQQRSCSLPRHFSRGGGAVGAALPSTPRARPMDGDFRGGPVSSHPFSVQTQSHISQESGVVDGDDEIEIIDEELSDSMRVTRSHSMRSMQSLSSMMPEGNTSCGWDSVVDTASNSGRLSPVSPSDLPDSPTQCALLPQYCSRPAASSGPTTTNSNPPTTTSLDVMMPPMALQISMPGARPLGVFPSSRNGSRNPSDVTSIPSEEPTPTFAAAAPRASRETSQGSDDDVLPGPADDQLSERGGDHDDEDEDDYAAFPIDDGLLEQSIQAALPPLKMIPSSRQNDNERLLNEAIEAALPKKSSCPPVLPSESAGLLDAAILAAMPSSSPAHSPFHPKNVGAGGRGRSTRPPVPAHTASMTGSNNVHHNTYHQHPINSSVLMSATEAFECVRDGSQLLNRTTAVVTSTTTYVPAAPVATRNQQHRDSDESSGSDTFPNGDDGEFVADLPMDVLEELEEECDVVSKNDVNEKSLPAMNKTTVNRVAEPPTRLAAPSTNQLAARRPSGLRPPSANFRKAKDDQQPKQQVKKSLAPLNGSQQQTPSTYKSTPPPPPRPITQKAAVAVAPYNYRQSIVVKTAERFQPPAKPCAGVESSGEAEYENVMVFKAQKKSGEPRHEEIPKVNNDNSDCDDPKKDVDVDVNGRSTTETSAEDAHEAQETSNRTLRSSAAQMLVTTV